MSKSRGIQLSKRKENIVNSQDFILILCEGKESEPNYFNDLKDELKLSNVKIRQCLRGNDPLNIVKEAIKYTSKYDRVYCVFDKEDPNAEYNQACQMIKDHNCSFKIYEQSNPIFDSAVQA